MHIENVDIQFIMDSEYKQLFAITVAKLIKKRKSLRFSQSEMASWCGCSLRKIQMFEKHKSLDHYIVYAYNEKFKMIEHE